MLRRCHYLTGIVLVGVIWLSPAAWAADFTWSGASTSPFWSNATNWVGGVAPSGSVGTLRFPALPGSRHAGCGISGERCFAPVDDIEGLDAAAISFDLGAPYVFGYTIPMRTLTLGSGGLTAGGGDHQLYFPNPIALSAPQSWSIAGARSHVDLGTVTGGGIPLAVDFSGGSSAGLRPSLELKAGAEIGAITATGVGTIELDDQASLNGTDGNAVSLAHAAELDVVGRSSTGPITSTGGLLVIGSAGGRSPGGALTIGGTGNISLDASSQVALSIIRSGRTPGKDYGQVKTHGAVGLDDAILDLVAGSGGGDCPKLKRGDVETLVMAAGSIKGIFHHDRRFGKVVRNVAVPNGASIALSCQSARPPTVRIHYTAHSVTATVRRG